MIILLTPAQTDLKKNGNNLYSCEYEELTWLAIG